MNAVITGFGAVTPLGTAAEMWLRLLTGESAARMWPDLEEQGFRITTACRIPDFCTNPVNRGQELAITAVRQAVMHANLPLEGRIGVYVGTTMGESAAFERAAEGLPLNLTLAAASAYPRVIRRELGIDGPVYAYGTACAAGNYAIGAAATAIRLGRVDCAIAGGVDAFSRIAMLGFSRSRAMAPDVCRPFDAERGGMQLGEGAAFVILEREADANARGAKCYARVAALGLSCDAFHPTAPRPDGAGMVAALRSALQIGQIYPEDVGFICAHGTGTRASDAAEATAIAKLFPHNPAVSGVKGALGHSLGAATAVEAVITVLALCHKVLPPTTNLRSLDPEMHIAIVTTPVQVPDLHWALNCGYAFGGLNSALLLEAVE